MFSVFKLKVRLPTSRTLWIWSFALQTYLSYICIVWCVSAAPSQLYIYTKDKGVFIFYTAEKCHLHENLLPYYRCLRNLRYLCRSASKLTGISLVRCVLSLAKFEILARLSLYLSFPDKPRKTPLKT